MSEQQPAEPSRRSSDLPPRSVAEQGFRGVARLVTNVTKIVGLCIAFHEAVLRPHHDPATLALAAFMMAGAQVSEGVAIAFLDRFFGKPPP